MKRTRILIVEDEAIVARDISLQLARAGYERAGVTARGEDAVVMAGQLKPDLVLMDIQLGGTMDGIAAATQIRERHQIPVVFITAYADERVLERARQAEPFGYIVKPFEERELQPAIEIALHKHRTEAALRRSEERFRRLFNGVRDAVILADGKTGTLLEANDEACRMFTRSREELVGTHFSLLHPAGRSNDYRAFFEEHADGRSTELREAEIVTSNGHIVPVEVNAGLVDLGDRRAVLGVFRDISPRLAAEQAVRDRQARLDAIFRAAPVGIGVVVDRVITEVNERVSLMTGYGREDLIGQSSRIFYATQEEFERVGKVKYAEIKQRGTGTIETQWQGKDGRIIDVLLSSTPINPGDLSVGLTFTAVDITERKRTRAELAQRNRVLEGLQRISHAMLEESNDNAVFMRIAAEIAGMLQVRCAAVMMHDAERRVLRLVGQHGVHDPGAEVPEIPVTDALAGRVIESGAPVVHARVDPTAETLHPLLFESGPRSFAGVPLRIGGRIAGVLAVAHDRPWTMDETLVLQLTSIADHLARLVERREAQSALLRSETELLAIYDHAPVIVCLLDEDARIIRANQTAARFAGRPVDELNGAAGGEFLSCLGALDDVRGCGFGPQCTQCKLRLTILDTLKRGTSHAQVEICKTTHHGGATRELSMLLSTARVQLDGRQRILVVLEDITENRRLTEQLMRAQRMESIGTLASGIAHDLNNVLAPIVMCLGMLREAIRDPGTAELVNTMQVAANRGADIVRQVLTFARGMGGERVVIQPKHVIQETARIARETFPRSIEVCCDYGRDLQTVLGDPTQIQQVLMNLCVNARDAMAAGGQLSIRADNAGAIPDDVIPAPKETTGRYVALRVKDTGIGMPPSVKDRIFDPFFTTKPVGKGTGLGLAVTLGIVERHGGHIHVDSQPGHGTTFSVYLPAVERSTASTTATVSDEYVPPGRGETVLVVDDEPGVRTVMHGMLEKSGYGCVTARDGREALAKLASLAGAVRLVISDVMMAGMDGLELIPYVRQFSPTLPIIAMTGLGDDEVRAAAQSLGAHRILNKPFSNSDLLWAVHELLSGAPAPRD